MITSEREKKNKIQSKQKRIEYEIYKCFHDVAIVQISMWFWFFFL